jgi:ferredoxin
MSSPREAQTPDGRGPRIEVDRKRCEGHGLCARTAPELLHLDQIGELVINGRELGGEALDKARAAVRACPVAALRLSEA